MWLKVPTMFLLTVDHRDTERSPLKNEKKSENLARYQDEAKEVVGVSGNEYDGAGCSGRQEEIVGAEVTSKVVMLDEIINYVQSLERQVEGMHTNCLNKYPNQTSFPGTPFFLFIPSLERILEVFNRMPKRDGVSWNLIISGYASRGLSVNALEAYKLMVEDGGMSLNRITFSMMLILSWHNGWIQMSRQIQGQIVKWGFELYVFVDSPLVDMYAKAGFIYEAEKNGLDREALVLFRKMRLEGLPIDQFIFGSILTACGGLQTIKLRRQTSSCFYSQNLSQQERNGFSEEAVKAFCDMQKNGIEPDDFTLGSVISSCANLASLEEGAQFHGQALVSGLISFITVSNALVTLYDAIGWAALLSSCRTHGNMEIGKWAAASLLELDPENPATYILLTTMYAVKGNWTHFMQKILKS
ncbi:hypothetical protein HAX54_017192 [Datura stramonium]|uniref:Pentatricopeptide repeat-containing protein n=1 Tax=Datura stramonium TaxID=4076 RepID=A0ABS8S079_DATST|nr:hypothetical protein [Datura stramonium]